MGLLAKERMLLVLTACLFLNGQIPAWSGDRNRYGFSPMDYFPGKAARFHAHELALPGSIWNEITISEKGEVRSYHPPDVVVDFLDDPSPENARKYIEWNIQRLEKIEKAVQVLEQISTVKER